jgi:hypothetical protein
MLARRTCFAVKQAFQNEKALEQFHFEIAQAAGRTSRRSLPGRRRNLLSPLSAAASVKVNLL